ncbi:MAG: hypothetical protein U0175_32890 [Caldilineaceae bacterium]
MTGGLTWSGGLLSGSGQTIVQGSTTLTGATYLKSISAQRLSLGNTVWEASANTGNGPILWRSGAVITLRTGATFDMQGDCNRTRRHRCGASFQQPRHLHQVGCDANTQRRFYFPFNNIGTPNVNAGKLQLVGTGVNSATMTINAGVTLDIDNAYTNAASGVINGNGTLDLKNATFTNNGTIAPTVTVIN